MLQNEYLVVKIGVDTAENEPLKNLTSFFNNFSFRSFKESLYSVPPSAHMVCIVQRVFEFAVEYGRLGRAFSRGLARSFGLLAPQQTGRSVQLGDWFKIGRAYRPRLGVSPAC